MLPLPAAGAGATGDTAMSSTQHQLIEQCATRLRGIVEALDNIHDSTPHRWSTDLDEVHSSAESLLALINDQAPTQDIQGLAGNGSLRHPCPAHERAAFELFVRKHCGMPEHIAVNWDAKFTNDAWEGWQARATLAQPSPAPVCTTPTGENCPGDGVKSCKKCPEQAEAEAERPNQPERYTADVFHPNRPYYMAQTTVVRASDFDAFAAQYERIVGALRAESAKLSEALDRWPHIRDRLKLKLRAALARVAELELKLDQSDYAYDNDRHHMRGMAKQAAEAIQIFTGHDSGANLAQRYGEKWWEHLDELRDAPLTFAKNAPVAQAQHSTGYAEARKCANCRHIGINDAGADGNCPECGAFYELEAQANVPAQAQHSVPEGWMLVPVEQLLNMMSDKDHDTRIMAERQLLAVLAAAPGKEGGRQCVER